MNTLLLSALFASMTAMGGMKAPADTIDRYIVNGMVMDDIDGAELKGVITEYDYDFYIKTKPGGKKGGETVIREHNIKISGGIYTKDNLPHDKSIDKMSYAVRMSSYPAYQKGGLYGGVPDTLPKPLGQVMVSRSVHAYGDRNLNPDDVLVIIDGRESEDGLASVSSDNVKSIEVLKGTSAKDKFGDKGKNGVIIVKTKGEPEYEDARYVVDGKKMTREELARMDKSGITTISIEHTELNLDEFKRGQEPMVIETTTKTTYTGNDMDIFDPFYAEKNMARSSDTSIGWMSKQRGNSYIETSVELDKCLVVLDGKEIKRGLSSVDPETVGSVYFMEGDEARKQYGVKGQNGVLIITSKGKKAPDYTIYIVDGKRITKEENSKLTKADYMSRTIVKRDYDLSWYFKTGANTLIMNEDIIADWNPNGYSDNYKSYSEITLDGGALGAP